jgi:hypothetical protein
VEPYLNVTRTSSIDNFSRIVVTEGGDGTVGNATNMNYGLRNRFYAKRRTAGRPSQAQEIVSVEVSQTYYTDQRSVQYDRDYTSTHLDAPPSHFSPVRLSSRVSPANAFNATMSAEFDARYKQFRDMSVNGTYNWAGRVQSTAGWTKRFFIADLPGWNNPDFLGHYLNASTNVRTANNRYGTIYEFYYNLRETTMVRQSVTAFFNAQCCGIAMQYHRVNYGIYSPIPTGNRFFLSVTLAGLGNFSPFSGAMAGVPR